MVKLFVLLYGSCIISIIASLAKHTRAKFFLFFFFLPFYFSFLISSLLVGCCKHPLSSNLQTQMRTYHHIHEGTPLFFSIQEPQVSNHYHSLLFHDAYNTTLILWYFLNDSTSNPLQGFLPQSDIQIKDTFKIFSGRRYLTYFQSLIIALSQWPHFPGT